MARVFIGSVMTLLSAACLALGQSTEKIAAPAEIAPAPKLVAPAHPDAQPGDTAFVPGTWGPLPAAVEAPVHEISEPACTAACAPPDHLWFSADYLIWAFKRTSTPPLVSAGPPTTSNGILGNAGTDILFGNPSVEKDDNLRSGGRVEGGFWLDPRNKDWAVEAGFFFFGERSNDANFGPAGETVLSRPIVSINKGAEKAELITFPGLSHGVVQINNPSRLWGAEANLMKEICGGCCYGVALIAGFRYVDLNEDLDILETKQFNDPVPPVFVKLANLGGDTLAITDRFGCQNHFYGGQVGLDSVWNCGCFSAELRGKVAVGSNQETINISGGQVLTTPTGVTTSFPGGLLALPSNMGRFRHNELAAIPEGGVNIGYHLTSWLFLYGGYTMTYWNRVVRPGDQIDRVVDTTQISNFPTTATPSFFSRPAVPFQQATFWAQGANFGFEVGW